MSVSYKMINNDFNNQLIECSILTISLLLKHYKAKEIEITDFKNHTINKISYITNNLDTIKDSIEKAAVESLINECNEIFNTI